MWSQNSSRRISQEHVWSADSWTVTDVGRGGPRVWERLPGDVMQVEFVSSHSRRVIHGMATEFFDLFPLSDQLPNLMPHAIGFTPLDLVFTRNCTPSTITVFYPVLLFV